MGFRMSRGAFYPSIGTIGMIGTDWGCILLAHWYDVCSRLIGGSLYSSIGMIVRNGILFISLVFSYSIGEMQLIRGT